MTTRYAISIAHTGYVGKNSRFELIVGTKSRSDLFEAIVDPEESSSNDGIGAYATWTKENLSSATLEENN